jgi:hypothetical protein
MYSGMFSNASRQPLPSARVLKVISPLSRRRTSSQVRSSSRAGGCVVGAIEVVLQKKESDARLLLQPLRAASHAESLPAQQLLYPTSRRASECMQPNLGYG